MAPEPVVLLSLEERVRRFGVLCNGPIRRNAAGEWEQSDGILFRGGEWEAGGEYIQTLTVKNVTTTMKKLKYRLPRTRYFSLAYPETMELPPGMSRDIDVVFRPLLMETYEDSIYFKLEEQPIGGLSKVPLRGFHVPVRALLSTLQATVPSGLDFGLCATNEVSERFFELTNSGQVAVPFEWKVPAPFNLEPMTGTIPVGGAMTMRASLLPTQATVVVGRALCEIGNGVQAVKPEPLLEMRLSAIGKYAHIVLSESRLDFGDVLAGSIVEDETCVQREVTLRNRSVVPATVTIVRLTDGQQFEPAFKIVTPKQFVVPPESEVAVRVVFDPRAWGTYSAETYAFVTPGGNRPELILTGTAAPPAVRLTKQEDPMAQGLGVTNSVNFGSVHVGQHSTRALFLSNDSELPVTYQFVLATEIGDFSGNGADFTISSREGTIPAKLEVNVKLAFAPLKPANYARRLFVIVHNRAPLFVDLLGTAFVSAKGQVKEQRPAPLRHAHLQAFRNRMTAGLGKLSPDELEDLHEEATSGDSGTVLALDKTQTSRLFSKVGFTGHDAVLETTKIPQPVTRSGESTRDVISPAHEMYRLLEDHSDPESSEIQISTLCVDLGNAQVGSQQAPPRRFVTLTNSTHAKVCVNWRAPPGDSREQDFVVVPESAEIGAGRSMDFRVEFRPSMANVYCFAELEAAVFFKSQRTFRLVDDSLLSPPWHFAVSAFGQTFAGEQFAPQISWDPKEKCSFPATHVGDVTYQTLKLRNRSNLPAVFKFDEGSSEFNVVPKMGLIKPNSFHLALARFKPREVSYCEHRLKLTVNGERAQGPFCVGLGQLPSVELRGLLLENSSLTFQPTSVGLSSTRTFEVVNSSRVPLVYSVALPSEARKSFALKQLRSGVLRGQEKATIQITFAPQKKGLQNARCAVSIRALAGCPPPGSRDGRQFGDAESAPIIQKLNVKLVAPGSMGCVFFEPAEVDYDTLLVNTTESKELVLANASDCALEYSMAYRSDEQIGMTTVVSKGKACLLVDAPCGVLPARSRTRVKVTFQPDAAGDFEFALVCKVHALDGNGNRVELDPGAAALLALGDTQREQEIKEMPLSCILKGRASFPTVVARDVRVEGGGNNRLGCSTEAMWTHFSLSKINSRLLLPLTAAEVAFNLESSPDRSRLERYPLKFVPEASGSAPQVVLVDLHNPGSLPTTFSIHLPNEKNVELEMWADEGEPTENELRTNRVIDELKCFEVSPRHALVQPGSSVTLRFAYAFNCHDKLEGKHVLPVLLKVAQGKQMWLELTGHTLGPREPLLIMASDPLTQELALQPVTVGTRVKDTPLHFIELTNVSNVDVEYSLDYTQPRPLPKAVEEAESDGEYETDSEEEEEAEVADIGIDLLRIEDKTSGLMIIPARSTRRLRLRFLPLMPREYAASLNVKYSSTTDTEEKRLDCRLKLAGYNAAWTDPWRLEKQAFSEAPPHAVIPPPAKQFAVLSHTRLSFGRLPQRAIAQQVVTIRPWNTDDDVTPLEYQWEAAHELIERGVVEIEPFSGTIAPGDVAVCRVIFKAECEPTILEASSILVLIKPKVKPPPTNTRGMRRRATGSTSSSRTLLLSTASQVQMMSPNASASSLVMREPLVTRPTVSRERFLTQTTLPNNRLPMMPTNASAAEPPPLGASTRPMTYGGLPTAPRTSNSSRPPTPNPPLSAAPSSMMSVRTTTSVVDLNEHCFLSLGIVAEVVSETQFLELHSGATKIAELFVPRPLKFVPPSNEPTTRESEQLETLDRKTTPTEKRAALRAAMSEVFEDVLKLYEVRSVFQLLPETPVVPFYFEQKAKRSIFERIFQRIDANGDGVLTYGELRDGLLNLGVRAALAETKEFFRKLQADREQVVNMKEWFMGLSPNVVLAIEDAVDESLHAEATLLQEQRQEERIQRLAPEYRAAATKINNVARARAARKTAAYKLKAVGQFEENRSASKIQAANRGRRTRLLKKGLEDDFNRLEARRLLAQPDFQNAVLDAMEGTLFNLLQEAIHGEFDLKAQPVQRILPTSQKAPNSPERH